MEKALEEHKRELEQRDQQRAGFETMLAKLQAKAKLEAERGVKLDETLKECRQEMNAHIEQLEAAKHKHEQEMKEKMEEVIVKYGTNKLDNLKIVSLVTLI